MSEEYPLFPLNTVLFSRGILPLRIFEPRYLSMVSTCMKQDRGFGVVLIKSGQEAGTAATFHETGTLATIQDFHQLEDGSLGLTCRGQELFKVNSHFIEPDQLIKADLTLFAEEPDFQIPEEYYPLRDFLNQIMEREELQAYREDLDEFRESAQWISCRLAEILPLPPATRQILLESSIVDRLPFLQSTMLSNKLIS